jgi:hypothetical protein
VGALVGDEPPGLPLLLHPPKNGTATAPAAKTKKKSIRILFFRQAGGAELTSAYFLGAGATAFRLAPTVFLGPLRVRALVFVR